MKRIGLYPVLSGGIPVHDKYGNIIRTMTPSKKRAYRLLIQRLYHPLAVQQEWLKQQILNDK